MQRLMYVVLCSIIAMPAVARGGSPADDGSEPGWEIPTNSSEIVVESLIIPAPVPGCVDAELQTTAVATRSGGGQPPGYGPELANNGIYGVGNAPSCCVSGGCWHWISAGYVPGTAWYELTWPADVGICQIWVDTKSPAAECGGGQGRVLGGAQIQTWDGAQYVTHGTITDQLDDWSFTFSNCQNTTRLRLYGIYANPAAGGQESNPILYEVKVYGCHAQPAAPVVGSFGLFLTIGLLLAVAAWKFRRRWGA